MLKTYMKITKNPIGKRGKDREKIHQKIKSKCPINILEDSQIQEKSERAKHCETETLRTWHEWKRAMAYALPRWSASGEPVNRPTPHCVNHLQCPPGSCRHLGFLFKLYTSHSITYLKDKSFTSPILYSYLSRYTFRKEFKRTISS